MQKVIVSVVVVCAVAVACAARQPYDRYQSIVDRQMFGPLPPGFDPTKSPAEVAKSSSSAAAEKELTKEQEKIKSSIHFSMINVTPEGTTAIGFTDNSDPKAPVNYYLKVGEKRNGWEVKEADAEAATMTIAKGDVEVSLSLGGDSSKDGGAKGASPAAAAPAARGGGFGAHRGLLGSGGFGNTLRGRRMQRQQEAAAQQAAEAERAKQQAEEREARKAERRAKEKVYRAEHKAEISARMKAWRAANADKVHEYNRRRDIREKVFNEVQGMTLDDVVAYQQQNIKGRTYSTCVLGNEAELDMDSLANWGTIVRLTTEQIFGY